jgi:hypothetical protein
MDPRLFQATFVDGNIIEFRDNAHDLRRAANVIWAVDALAAHIYEWAKTHAPAKIEGKTEKQYRNALADRSQGYKLLRHAADAMKHAWLGDKKADIKRSSDVANTSGAFQSNAFAPGYQLGEAVVVLQDKRCYPVDDLITASMKVLEAEMETFGVP